jgi:hypothetical protein
LFDNKDNLVHFMTDHGAERILFKCLSENDNSKQQIYFGGSFEALNQIPYGEVIPDNIDGKQPNYKATLNYWWVNSEGQVGPALNAKLILYPKYPEVRLSGFLQNCSIAPREYLQPIAPGARRYNNGKDGRILVMGICSDGKIIAHLAPAGTYLSNELTSMADNSNIFTIIETDLGLATKLVLLSKIKEIQDRGWIPSCKMGSDGNIILYNATNAGGYTLEACFGIIPNGRSEPDWRGWELKAYAGSKITLMTPEPDAGYYGEHNVADFVRKYGKLRTQGDRYFTGIHKCGHTSPRTGMKMILDGFDETTSRIVKVTGGLTLLDSNGDPAAIWTYAKLIEHWGRKHAHTVYVPYSRRCNSAKNIEYQYANPVKLGEVSDFSKFLSAFNRGNIVYDPASKLFVNERGNTQTKARNQFRMHISAIKDLYSQFSTVNAPSP